MNEERQIDPSIAAMIRKLRQQREMHADEAANLHVSLEMALQRIKDLESKLDEMEGKQAA